jgi:hypothetical protein
MKVGPTPLTAAQLGVLGGPDAVWYTRWELPTSAPTTADQGHYFYAAMEIDNGGTPYFFDGESTCGVASSHCKALGYPATHTLTTGCSYDPTTGTITIRIRTQDVGGTAMADAPRYSVIGFSATEAQPSSSTSIFNVIDSTPPYDDEKPV